MTKQEFRKAVKAIRDEELSMSKACGYYAPRLAEVREESGRKIAEINAQYLSSK